MFDIGFFELSLIGVVALVVIGPERLPAVARTAGKWVGRANRFISSVKDDISKELKDEELQKILQQQKDLANDFKQAAEQTGSALNQLNPSELADGLLEIDESSSSDSITTKKKKKKKKKKKSEKALTNESEKTTSAKDNNSTSTISSETIESNTTSSDPTVSKEVITETN